MEGRILMSCMSCGEMVDDIYKHVCYAVEDFDVPADRTEDTGKSLDQWESLILEVEKRPILWNFTLPLKDRSKEATSEAWREVSEEIQLNVKEVQSKWRYLRDKYVKTKKEVEGYKPSGSASTSTKVWKYYTILQFLKPYVQSRKTRSNMELNVGVDQIPVEPIFSPASELSEESASGSTSTPLSKKKRYDSEAFNETLLQVLKAPPPQFPVQDEVDGFCARLAGSLRRLPRRKRAQVEIKMLQILQEAEDDD